MRFLCFISVCQKKDNPSRISDEQVQHVEKRVGTSRKKEWGGRVDQEQARPWTPPLAGGKEPNYQQERRTEILLKRWAYSRVKVRRCQSSEEIKTGKAKNTVVSLIAGAALPPSAPQALNEASQAGGGRKKKENNPPHHQKLEGHNLCSLIL